MALIDEIERIEKELAKPPHLREITVQFSVPGFITERSHVTISKGRYKDRAIYNVLSVRVIRDGTNDPIYEARLERVDE